MGEQGATMSNGGDGTQPNSPSESPAFWLGVTFAVVTLCLLLYAFFASDVTCTQVNILNILIPFAFAVASAGIAGSITAQAENLIPRMTIGATGGFAVWLILTQMTLLPKPEDCDARTSCEQSLIDAKREVTEQRGNYEGFERYGAKNQSSVENTLKQNLAILEAGCEQLSPTYQFYRLEYLAYGYSLLAMVESLSITDEDDSEGNGGFSVSFEPPELGRNAIQKHAEISVEYATRAIAYFRELERDRRASDGSDAKAAYEWIVAQQGDQRVLYAQAIGLSILAKLNDASPPIDEVRAVLAALDVSFLRGGNQRVDPPVVWATGSE